MSAKYMALVRDMIPTVADFFLGGDFLPPPTNKKTRVKPKKRTQPFQPDEEKPAVVKKKDYVVFRHKPSKKSVQRSQSATPETSIQAATSDDSSSDDSDGDESSTKPNTFLTSFIKSASKAVARKKRTTKEDIELKPKKRRARQKALSTPPSSSSEQIKMYLPRRPGGFFKGVLIFAILLMLIMIFNNTDDTLILTNMSIMPSLPNIFDPSVLLNQKVTRVTDMMGDNEHVLIRENVTTILEHRVFFREAVPRSNVTSNGLTVVLLHDKHTESSGGTGCCSGLWLWLGTLHRLGQEGFHVIALDLPGYGFSEGVQLDIRESAPFMKDFIELFKLTGIILVAPSTSIKVALPFASSHPDLLTGLVIPSPTTTLKYTNEANMEKLTVPTMITFGVEDTSAASDYDKVLSKIPNHKLIKLESRTVDDGVKLVYLDDPSHFHDNVVNFAKGIN